MLSTLGAPGSSLVGLASAPTSTASGAPNSGEFGDSNDPRPPVPGSAFGAPPRALESGQEKPMPQNAVATAVCQINLLNDEYHVEVRDWPATLLAHGGDLLELEGRLFRSGAKEVILHRRDMFARFLLVDDAAELLVQDVPGPQ